MIWKDLEDHFNYSISSTGLIKNNKTGKILKHWLDNNSKGYPTIAIKNKKFSIHRLMAITFLPNPENKREVNHIDGNKQNNVLSNLEWVTRSENGKHSYKLGLSTYRSGNPKGKGNKNAMAKLSEKDVLKIRKLRKEKVMCKDLAIMFNVCRDTISLIVHNKIWKHI